MKRRFAKYGILTLTTLVIAALFLAGWASAQGVDIREKTFKEKLKLYLTKAWNKILSLLKKPLSRLNEWFKAEMKKIKPRLYEELEEMKVSLLDLLKWGWQEGVKSRL